MIFDEEMSSFGSHARKALEALVLTHLALLAACGGCGSVAPRRAPAAAPIAVPAAPEPPPFAPRYSSTVEPLPEGRSYVLHRFSMPVAQAAFQVVDLGEGRPLEDVLRETGAALVVNAGYYDPQFQPEGLAIVEGRELHAILPRISGGVLIVDGDRATLQATEELALPPSPRFAIQCSPRLVVDSTVNIARDDGRMAARTALCIRDEGRTLDVLVARTEGEEPESVGRRGPTLFALATTLLAMGCESALNLDGGPSTGMAYRVGDDVVAIENPRPVREALAILAR